MTFTVGNIENGFPDKTNSLFLCKTVFDLKDFSSLKSSLPDKIVC